jgi:hypothetical protein
MFRQRLLAACLSLGIVLATLPLVANADVVYGNLGATGTGGLSSTLTDFGPGAATTLALAQGFTTGAESTNLEVQSVTIGAFATSSGNLPRTVSIYSNSSNAPGSVLFTSSPTNVGNNGKYTFSFSGASLSGGTSYWVVPDFSSDWSWILNAEETQPDGLNTSGYSYLGTKRQATSNPGTWVNSFLPYSLSVTAVPEPSTYAMVAAAAGLLGVAKWRRRRS